MQITALIECAAGVECPQATCIHNAEGRCAGNFTEWEPLDYDELPDELETMFEDQEC